MKAAVELEWGIRNSFLAYVDSLPDGSIRADAGAVREGNVFRLPGLRRSAREYIFEGALHFFGYAGILDVSFDDIQLSLTRDLGEVSASVDGTRIRLVDLAEPETLVPGTIVYNTATLTDDGAALLGGVYPPGAPADPVTIRVR